MKIALYVLGILTGLAFARIPHYYPALLSRGDDDSLPEGYAPKYRHWTNGVLDE